LFEGNEKRMLRTSARPAIDAVGVVRRYGELTAVDRITFQVVQGEAFGLLGPNGAGKSTLMRMIYCRSPLTEGRLHVVGHDVTTEARQVKARVGVVPQENNLDPDLNLRENLLVYARYFRIPRSVAEERADRLIAFAELDEKRTARIETLSGGMKRRLMIARALINDPAVLILDEPTTGLDPHVRQAIWDKLRHLREQGLTILLSTHYMDEAEKLCDRLMLMDRGTILVSGPPRSLIEEHAGRVVLEVRGTPLPPLPLPDPTVVVEEHATFRHYYAASAEQLAPLIRACNGCETYLRPANLEDVFMRLTDRSRLT
jgi:lipooligosaccharide transport system ATP-binding protein